MQTAELSTGMDCQQSSIFFLLWNNALKLFLLLLGSKDYSKLTADVFLSRHCVSTHIYAPNQETTKTHYINHVHLAGTCHLESQAATVKLVLRHKAFQF